MQFLLDHWNDILTGVGGLYIVVKIIVDRTPTKKDDEFLAKYEKPVQDLAEQIPALLELFVKLASRPAPSAQPEEE